MAESIIIHFSESKLNELTSVFDSTFERIADTWYSPTNADYRVSIYPYPDYATEYDKPEREEVENMLGCRPQMSFCIELRRSRGNEACELAKSIILEKLNSFKFVVDDCQEKIWNQSDIVKHKDRFLRQYYY